MYKNQFSSFLVNNLSHVLRELERLDTRDKLALRLYIYDKRIEKLTMQNISFITFYNIVFFPKFYLNKY